MYPNLGRQHLLKTVAVACFYEVHIRFVLFYNTGKACACVQGAWRAPGSSG
jgi:hypothetical protein